jgi:hypothetical protein
MTPSPSHTPHPPTQHHPHRNPSPIAPAHHPRSAPNPVEQTPGRSNRGPGARTQRKPKQNTASQNQIWPISALQHKSRRGHDQSPKRRKCTQRQTGQWHQKSQGGQQRRLRHRRPKVHHRRHRLPRPQRLRHLPQPQPPRRRPMRCHASLGRTHTHLCPKRRQRRQAPHHQLGRHPVPGLEPPKIMQFQLPSLETPVFRMRQQRSRSPNMPTRTAQSSRLEPLTTPRIGTHY